MCQVVEESPRTIRTRFDHREIAFTFPNGNCTEKHHLYVFAAANFKPRTENPEDQEMVWRWKICPICGELLQIKLPKDFEVYVDDSTFANVSKLAFQV